MVNGDASVHGPEDARPLSWRGSARPPQALGFSQIALAHEAEIHPNVVGRLERGEYNPTIALLELLVKPLRVALSELIAAAEKRCGS